jgi:hypothetical protein
MLENWLQVFSSNLFDHKEVISNDKQKLFNYKEYSLSIRQICIRSKVINLISGRQSEHLALHCVLMRSGCRDIGCKSLCAQKILCTQDFGTCNQAVTVREQFPVKAGQLCPTLNHQTREGSNTW